MFELLDQTLSLDFQVCKLIVYDIYVYWHKSYDGCVLSGLDQGSVSVCTYNYPGFDLIWDVMFKWNMRNLVNHIPVSRFICENMVLPRFL